MQGQRGGFSLLASGLFLCWCFLFAALGADQRQEIFGVKRVQASGLLSGGTQGDIYAPIVGQDHHLQIIQHLLPVGRTQVRILRYQLLYLVGSQLVLFAKGPRLKVVRRGRRVPPGSSWCVQRVAP